MAVLCYWETPLQVFMVARCYWGMSLQVIKRIVMVGSRWCWVADSDAVLLGNRHYGVGGVSGESQRIVMVASRWCWVGDGGAWY